jgi:hypothetical protein
VISLQVVTQRSFGSRKMAAIVTIVNRVEVRAALLAGSRISS